MSEGRGIYDYVVGSDAPTGWYASASHYLMQYSVWITVLCVILVLVIIWYMWGSESFTNPSPMMQDTDDAYGLGDRSRSYFAMNVMDPVTHQAKMGSLGCPQALQYQAGSTFDVMQTQPVSMLNVASAIDAQDQTAFDLTGNMAGQIMPETAQVTPPEAPKVESFRGSHMDMAAGFPSARVDDPRYAPQIVGQVMDSDYFNMLHGTMYNSDNPRNIHYASQMKAHGLQPAM